MTEGAERGSYPVCVYIYIYSFKKIYLNLKIMFSLSVVIYFASLFNLFFFGTSISFFVIFFIPIFTTNLLSLRSWGIFLIEQFFLLSKFIFYLFFLKQYVFLFLMTFLHFRHIFIIIKSCSNCWLISLCVDRAILAFEIV